MSRFDNLYAQYIVCFMTFLSDSKAMSVEIREKL